MSWAIRTVPQNDTKSLAESRGDRSRMNTSPQAVCAHTLLYKTLTRRTRRRIKKSMVSATNPDDYQGGSAELRRVAHGLYNRALGMNRVAPTEAILANRNHFTTLEEDRNMVASHVLGRITSALREDIAVDVLLDPSREQMSVVNSRIEYGHPDDSLRRDVLRYERCCR